MPEILYEIPVNDIFDRPCECPVCAMKKKLDDDEVAFAMGPSYMEDDIRLTTDKIGFCAHHMQMMYDFEPPRSRSDSKYPYAKHHKECRNTAKKETERLQTLICEGYRFRSLRLYQTDYKFLFYM